ncbi:hypothetical protein [Halosegnis sp.]|uniref:hypothetical protein n=1 Tax=Halosegnis sp. TaxID=2864959 RepID=UPI0035D4771B
MSDRADDPKPLRRASLLWGAVGGLLFVVLVFGYRLATGASIGAGVALVGAAFVAVATAGLSYAVLARLA